MLFNPPLWTKEFFVVFFALAFCLEEIMVKITGKIVNYVQDMLCHSLVNELQVHSDCATVASIV